jgi:hypothetical protein
MDPAHLKQGLAPVPSLLRTYLPQRHGRYLSRCADDEQARTHSGHQGQLFSHWAETYIMSGGVAR